jgi:hypothetical protein
MTTFIEVPLDLMEAVAQLRVPPKTDELLQQLMDQKTSGSLTPAQLDLLEAFGELSVMICLFRARALHLLGQQPS